MQNLENKYPYVSGFHKLLGSKPAIVEKALQDAANVAAPSRIVHRKEDKSWQLIDNVVPSDLKEKIIKAAQPYILGESAETAAPDAIFDQTAQKLIDDFVAAHFPLEDFSLYKFRNTELSRKDISSGGFALSVVLGDIFPVSDVIIPLQKSVELPENAKYVGNPKSITDLYPYRHALCFTFPMYKKKSGPTPSKKKKEPDLTTGSSTGTPEPESGLNTISRGMHTYNYLEYDEGELWICIDYDIPEGEIQVFTDNNWHGIAPQDIIPYLQLSFPVVYVGKDSDLAKSHKFKHCFVFTQLKEIIFNDPDKKPGASSIQKPKSKSKSKKKK